MNWSFANDEGFSDENFTGTEVDDYDTVLLPHNCTDPLFEQTATGSTETENGYTEYRCATCGYSYKADYLPVIGNYVDPEEINNNLMECIEWLDYAHAAVAKQSCTTGRE